MYHFWAKPALDSEWIIEMQEPLAMKRSPTVTQKCIFWCSSSQRVFLSNNCVCFAPTPNYILSTKHSAWLIADAK